MLRRAGPFKHRPRSAIPKACSGQSKASCHPGGGHGSRTCEESSGGAPRRVWKEQPTSQDVPPSRSAAEHITMCVTRHYSMNEGGGRGDVCSERCRCTGPGSHQPEDSGRRSCERHIAAVHCVASHCWRCAFCRRRACNCRHSRSCCLLPWAAGSSEDNRRLRDGLLLRPRRL